MTDHIERAKQEADVLKLIYGDNVLYCKMFDCWKRFTHLQIGVHIANGETEAVDLEFTCPPKYPEQPPKFSLTNPVGLTQRNLNDLSDLLNEKIDKFVGSEVLYDLCAETQTFLTNKDAAKKSMHERMVTVERQNSSSSINAHPTRNDSIKRQHNRNSFTDYEIEAKAPSEVKKEEELKCRRNQLLKQIGTLGSTIKVELLSKPGQLIEVSKIMSFDVSRKPLNNSTYEWYAFDQNRVLLVSEHRFDSSVNHRNKEALVNFGKTLSAFVESAKNRSYANDNFLTQFAFFHLKKEKRNRFSTDLLVGQYIDIDSKCLGAPKVLTELKNKKKTLLPRLANHLLCGLKTLHEQRFIHGNLGLESVWINSDDNFLISDHSLMPEILNLYDQFAQINTINEKQRQSSVSSLRLKDFQMLSNLLKSLSNDFNAIPDREAFDDFISQSSRPDVDAQRLLNHSFLYQGFNSMSDMSDESLLSSGNLISMENAGRLVTEYNVLGFLGSGGFGSVFLARNKLDANDYAIKRISLSGMSKKQVEKIKNEVAVFSRLSHEHITRYFSSWVETIELKDGPSESETSVSSSGPDFSLENELPAQIRNLPNESKLEESEEVTAESETSVSSSGPGFFRGGPKRPSKIPAVLPNIIMSQGGSDLSIMFAEDSEDGDNDKLEDLSERDEENSRTVKPKTASFLCLQMEFCSNKTLRSVIDHQQLYLNNAMIWRLFKEILLGLEFMHSYNLIHRDIKPGNIFLDSSMSVKIGDFGLATRLATVQYKESADKDKGFQTYSMTKNIGTVFYMPPEAKRTNVAIYDEKFDIYSTGIVLFEMILKPPDSRSERVSCLERLRSELVMPDDYLNYLPEKQRESADSIIKWCLRENPEERPSATELLHSELLPQIISEEDRFLKTCAQIAQDTKHRYRRLLFNELFTPVLPASISILYDKNYCLEQQKRRRLFTYNSAVTTLLSDFFRSHGFTQIPIESLVPAAENYSTDNDLLGTLSKPYKLIDEHGVILTLPTNLRQTLARHIAHSNVHRLRSFSIDQIHSRSASTSAFSSHPDSRTEFCLDIIRPQASNADLAAIEILQLVIELSRKLHPLSSTSDTPTRWQILLNHTDLVKAIGIHYSISEQQRLCSFFNVLYDFNSRLKKTEYSTVAFEFARNFNIAEKQANELIQLIDTPVRTIHKLRENLRPIINSRNVRSLVDHSISEMDLIFQKLVHNLDASLEFTFLPSFVYQPLIFNTGLLFSLRVEISDKGKKFWVPIVGGGRYDQFLQKTRQINEPGSSIDTCCAYGINISAENITHLLRNSGGNLAERFGLPFTVLITCTSIAYLNAGHELAKLLREKVSMLVELWDEEMPLNDSLFEYAREKFTNFIVALVSANEFVIYANCFDKSIGNNGFRLSHNRISLTDAFKFISSSTPKKEQSEAETQKSADLERPEPSNVPTNATLSNVNLVFCISRGFKITHHVKKRYESLVYAMLQNPVKRFNKNVKIDAYITELPPEILTQISNLDRSAGQNHVFVEFEAIANSQAKYKTEVKLLWDELESFFQQPSTSSVVFLFCPRISETFYRVLL